MRLRPPPAAAEHRGPRPTLRASRAQHGQPVESPECPTVPPGMGPSSLPSGALKDRASRACTLHDVICRPRCQLRKPIKETPPRGNKGTHANALASAWCVARLLANVLAEMATSIETSVLTRPNVVAPCQPGTCERTNPMEQTHKTRPHLGRWAATSRGSQEAPRARYRVLDQHQRSGSVLTALRYSLAADRQSAGSPEALSMA